uniref:Uncharacterized protein n=1 Tax=Panagrolaimus davidi TaxID=227884 RepID=A0A914R4J3_9BILA
MPASSTASSARSSEFQDKIKYLNSSCDQLIKFLDSGKLSHINHESFHKSDQIFDRHISNLHNGFIEYQTENGKLKHKLAEIDTKICEILNENDFLRWENGQYKIEMEGLRNQLDKENLLTKELKAEICCLKLNQDQINHIHSVKLKDELFTASEIAKVTEESLKRKMENFEREAKLKEMEYCRKAEILEDEINEKTGIIKKYEQKIDDLTEENYKVMQIFGVSVCFTNYNVPHMDSENFRKKMQQPVFQNTKKEMEEELRRFYEKEKTLEAKLTTTLTNLSTFDYCNFTTPYETPIFQQNESEKIQSLQNRINEIVLNNNNSKNENDLHNLLNEKTLQIFDLRERIVFLEEECRAVKDENKNSNILLQQMTKDMRVLLEAVKENKT